MCLLRAAGEDRSRALSCSRRPPAFLGSWPHRSSSDPPCDYTEPTDHPSGVTTAESLLRPKVGVHGAPGSGRGHPGEGRDAHQPPGGPDRAAQQSTSGRQLLASLGAPGPGLALVPLLLRWLLALRTLRWGPSAAHCKEENRNQPKSAGNAGAGVWLTGGPKPASHPAARCGHPCSVLTLTCRDLYWHLRPQPHPAGLLKL